MTTLRTLLIVNVALLALVGCGDQDLPNTNISGSVHGELFSFVSGTAESTVDGEYILTLADDPSHSCTSTPPGNYLTIVITGVASTGSFSAAGNVHFNRIEDSINHSESATSGSVIIEVLDAETSRRIEGDISASSEGNDVSGVFSVPIC